MALIGLEIANRGPFADGQAFGEVGAYERIDGIARFAVDPSHPANQAIVDLDKAERDADGRVHFPADFCILQPTDAARATAACSSTSSTAARKVVPRALQPAPAAAVADRRDRPRRRLPDAPRLDRRVVRLAVGRRTGPGLLGLEAPQALGEDGQPIVGPDRRRVPAERAARRPSPGRTAVHQPVPGRRRRPPGRRADRARLAGRRADRHRRASAGAFARDERRRSRCRTPRTSGSRAASSRASSTRSSTAPTSARSPGRACWPCATSPRSCATARADGNPCAGRIERAYGFGVSQSGRFLRHFLYARAEPRRGRAARSSTA